jgi:hypothetical protein
VSPLRRIPLDEDEDRQDVGLEAAIIQRVRHCLLVVANLEV